MEEERRLSLIGGATNPLVPSCVRMEPKDGGDYAARNQVEMSPGRGRLLEKRDAMRVPSSENKQTDPPLERLQLREA